MNAYVSACDDFGLYTYLNTRMDLPSNTETVLHFFEAIQKSYPSLNDFERREGEFVLQEEREQGSYRFVGMDNRRIWSGYMNPPILEDADEQHERVLEIAPYHLDLSPLNCEAVDVVFSFDFIYSGNHDEVVAEALAKDSPFEHIMGMPGAKILNFEPSIMLALDEACRLQCRLDIETRSNVYQVQTGNYSEIPISVYFTVRQLWNRQPHKNFVESYHNQRRIAQELVDSYVLPQIVKPLGETISSR
jgi:hypothetical protein